MKKIILLFVAALMLTVTPAAALAVDGENDAGLTPESRFYWFDRLAERITLLFTLDPEDKAQALSKIGFERLAEAGQVEGTETIGELVSEYQRNQNLAVEAAGDSTEALVGLTDDQVSALERLTALVESIEGKGQQKAAKAMAAAAKVLEKQTARLEKLESQSVAGASDKISRVMDKATKRLDRLAGKLAKLSEETQSNEVKKTAEEVAEHVKAMTAKHITVLEDRLEQAPEPAKAALRKVIERARERAAAREARGHGARGGKVDGSVDPGTDEVDASETDADGDDAATERDLTGRGRGIGRNR